MTFSPATALLPPKQGVKRSAPVPASSSDSSDDEEGGEDDVIDDESSSAEAAAPPGGEKKHSSVEYLFLCYYLFTRKCPPTQLPSAPSWLPS